jgi:hypothetical protein
MSRCIGTCNLCEEPIFEGDIVYPIDGSHYHKYCMDNMSVSELAAMLDLSVSDILDSMDIYAVEAEDDTEEVKAEYKEDFFRYYE